MRPRQQTSNEELALLVFAVVAIALVAAVELAGIIGGVLGSGSPVTVSAADALRTLVRLPGHLGAVPGAWPARARGKLAGETGMVAAIAIAITAWIAVLAVAVVVVGRAVDRARGSAARWATAADLGELSVRGPEKGRVTLGRFRSR